MNTHETYVSLEVAKLLKQAGFDWECISAYREGELYYYSENSKGLIVMNFNNAPEYMNQYSAPLLSIAQKWLREVKGIIISSDARDVNYIKYNATIHAIYEERNPELHIEDVGTIHFIPYGLICKGITEFYDTYEEALEAGIKKCLELILEKDDKD